MLMLNMRLCQLVDAAVTCDVKQVAAGRAAAESLPIQFIAGFFGKLLRECPKRAAVAVAERMNVIKLGVDARKAVSVFERVFVDKTIVARGTF
jgi:hypothetical protein